jgi:hypothetical protein
MYKYTYDLETGKKDKIVVNPKVFTDGTIVDKLPGNMTIEQMLEEGTIEKIEENIYQIKEMN